MMFGASGHDPMEVRDAGMSRGHRNKRQKEEGT